MKTRIFSAAMVTLAAVLLLSTATLAKGKEFRAASSLENTVDHIVKYENRMIGYGMWNHLSAGYDLPSAGKMSHLGILMVPMATWEAGTEAVDEVLHLEPWMCNTVVWDAGITTPEEALQLEAWMTGSALWMIYTDVREEDSSLESWMLESDCWTVKTKQIIPEADERFCIEPWMLDATNWK